MPRFALFLLVAGCAAAQAPVAFERGVVIPRVTCAAKPEQSYALYLPSNYTPERKWPVLFAFDPAARGRVPADLAKDAAEKYGYIVAGSNNSRNGPPRPQAEAADAMMQDVTTRFAVDPRRMYTTGFSGGARVAVMVALLCGDCIAGVFAQGAGFPASAPPSKDVRFSYFAAVGDRDFNHPELFELEQRLDELGLPHRLRVFEGPHRWAPAEVWQEALEWFELRAMSEGRRPRDDDFIRLRLAQARARATNRERASDLYAAYLEYRALAADFEKLAEVSRFAAKAAEMKFSEATRDGLDREEKEIKRQRALTAPYFSAFDTLRATPAERPSLMPQLYSLIQDLRRGAEREKSPEKARRRALAQVFAHSYEAGEAALAEKDHAFAIACFELAREARPEAPGPPFGLARAHAATGRKKQALEALREAIRKGLRDAELLRTTPEFAPLQSDPEFQRIVQSLEQASPPRP